jgi:C4-dicarboxylate-specific signal transduction histidine kinase
VSHARSEVFFRLDADRLDADNGHIRIVISSDGPAFEEASLAAFFEPFDDGARVGRQRGGRSLALPLANELTRALGGMLRASNRGGRPTSSTRSPTTSSANA